MSIRPPRLAFSLSVLVFALTVLTLLEALGAWQTAGAQLDPAAVQALGSVSGRVTDDAGKPLTGMRVDFYTESYRGNNLSWYRNTSRAVITGPDGRFTARLEPRTYRVGFSDPTGVYAEQYYTGAVTLASAADVVVMSNAIDDVSAQLRRGGRISGSVQDGAASASAGVAAYTRVAAEWQLVRETNADAKGRYEFIGLPPGTYHVCLAGAWDFRTGAQLCYEQRQGGAQYATDVLVVEGQMTGGIDIAVAGFVDLATLRGTVRDTNGAPLAGINVEANTWLNPDYTGTAARTDANGSYTLSASAPTEYQISFRDPAGFYVGQPYSATVVALPSIVLRGLDTTLSLGGRIQGAAVIPDAGIDSNVSIAALDGVAPSWLYTGNYNPSTTTYVINGLPPGVYRVCAIHFEGRPGYPVYACYPNRVPYDQAMPITVAAGSTVSGIDLNPALDPAISQFLYLPRVNTGAPVGDAAISGMVRGERSGSLAGITATLHARNEQNIWVPVDTVRTDANGVYHFAGLVPDEYMIEFSNPEGIYISQVYGSTGSGEGKVIAIGQGEQRSGIDVTLAPGGLISGGVLLDGVLLPVGDVFVAALHADSDELSSGYYGVYDPQTGAYVIGGLPPGAYKLKARNWDQRAAEFVTFYNGATDFATATPLTIHAGSRLQDINLILGRGGFDGVIAGVVTGDDGQPLGGMRVELVTPRQYEPGLLRLLYTTTNAQGEYRLSGLSGASYSLRVVDPDGVYSTGYLDGTFQERSAGPSEVLDGVTSPPANIQLVRGGFIRGRVRWQNGAPEAGAKVEIFAQGRPTVVVETDTAGSYFSGPLPPGSYTLCATGYHVMYMFVCFERGSEGDTQTSVAVTQGATVEDIDILFDGNLILPQ
jgi:protocatechuate 3,4-dioxygenase beta subunit